MTETKHTPGPWMLDGLTVYALNDKGWNIFASLVQDPNTPRSELLANARLMRAAPDMLEALEMVRDADDDCRADGLLTIPGAARFKIDAAIAKARGE